MRKLSLSSSTGAPCDPQQARGGVARRDLPNAERVELDLSKPATPPTHATSPNESDELLRLAVQVGGIGFYDTDFENNRTRFSPELCVILGLPIGTETTYAEASRLFDERDRAAVVASVEAARNSDDEGKWSGVHRVVRVDGTVRWVSIHGRRHYRDTANGRKVVRSIGTVIDITHVMETEAALRQSELRLRFALEAAQMGTFEADITGSEALIDAQEAYLLGLPEGTRAVSVADLRARVPLDDLRASDAKQERLTQHDEAYHHEFRIRMPDASERWLSAHADVRSNRIFGVNFDITERKRGEEALRESEARLRIATSGASLGVFEWDVKADRTVWENDRMYEIFGHTRADGTLSKRQLVENYLHPDDAQDFETALKSAMQIGSNFHAICRIKRKNGSQRWLQLDGKFQRTTTDDPLRLVGVVADITARKVLESRAKKLSERLVTIQEEERQRIAQELHDSTAQHLVAASLTLMSLKRKTRLEGDEERLWEDVEVSMGEALKELRTFSYLMHPPALQAAGLSSTLRHYLDGLASRSGLDIKLRPNHKVDRLPFDMQQSLFRIVQEALANVHRHASASHVTVELRWVAGRVHLIVGDNGRGVDAMSERGRVPLRPGIGMRSIRARVDQFGGDLTIRTGSHGTSIHVAVPISDAHRRSAKGSSPAASRRRSTRKFEPT
jgi:PAS domain S-box-containing protein